MLALVAALTLSAVSPPLPFIEDDYPAALALAKRRRVPLFVDAWAPWCHSCRFFRATVLTDESLRKLAHRFVWLALDTERPESAAFLEKFPISSWPTLMIIDPAKEVPVLKWLGSVTAAQLTELLEDGERSVGQPFFKDPMDALLNKAERLQGAGKSAEAARAYRQLLDGVAEGASWLARPRVVEAYVLALEDAGLFRECADAAIQMSPALPLGHPRSDTLGTGLVCAVLAPEPCPWRGSALAALEPLATQELADADQLADDRSGLYEYLIKARRAVGDAGGARKLAQAWWLDLEAEAGRAPTPEARAALDGHRVEAAVELGDPTKALPRLLESQRDLPADYNPPARLAVIDRELGRYPEALAASRRALELAFGPRRLRLLFEQASIYEKLGDAAGRRRVLQQALDVAAEIPPQQRPEREVAKIREALTAHMR